MVFPCVSLAFIVLMASFVSSIRLYITSARDVATRELVVIAAMSNADIWFEFSLKMDLLT